MEKTLEAFLDKPAKRLRQVLKLEQEQIKDDTEFPKPPPTVSPTMDVFEWNLDNPRPSLDVWLKKHYKVGTESFPHKMITASESPSMNKSLAELFREVEMVRM